MVFTERIELSSTDYQSVALPLCYMNIKQRKNENGVLFFKLGVEPRISFSNKRCVTISLFEVTIFYTTAMVEDVGFEPLLHIPNVAC